jgi:hypothetical protein
MKELAKNFLKKFGPPFLFSKNSYAQEGEDLVVNRLLEGKKNGFYVEVGAHHPYRFSNTYFFYKRGWSGICIDPLPGTKKAFNKSRPRDIALELGISSSFGQMQYFMFNEPALNTFDPAVAKIRDGKKGYRVINTVSIETKPLAAILAEINIPKSGIDLMSVDVEGLDYQVLSSFDWSKNHPRVIIAESDKTQLDDIQNDPICTLLLKEGYKLYAKTGHSLIFIS